MLVGVLAVNAILIATRTGPVADLIDGVGERTEAVRRTTDRFFDRYVTIDGRVVRRDQGGDTVSEGQAYAMLLAAATSDQGRFEQVWRWTREHLQRPDGLLAWRWADGAVVDDQPAADADLDAARALLIASERFETPAYRRQALGIAGEVLASETVRVAGEPILVAGPWAVEEGPPYRVNPSYVSPVAYRLLGTASGSEIWAELRRSDYRLLVDLTEDGEALPPDWALVEADGTARPATAPGADGEAPISGLEAARVLVRTAESCDEQGPSIAASAWPLLEPSAPGIPIEMSLDGDRRSRGLHPVPLVGAAAAAAAAGEADAADELLDEAEELDRETPTYYGSAWVALGRVLLTTEHLGGCPLLT